MITRGPASLAPMPTRRLRFDDYVLDLDRLCLLSRGAEIPLRPKTFAVLHVLAGNPARLISKTELFAAVWPNLAVTDDVLVQSIGELRRVLGHEGARLIRTIPRRGYRFEAVVLADGAPADAVSKAEPAPPVDLAPRRRPAVDPPPRSDPVTKTRAGRGTWTAVSLGLAGLFTVALSFGLATHWRPRTAATPDVHSAASLRTREAGPALAVLPLTDQSDDPAQTYFADGLTQDIINALGRFSTMTVVSWNGVRPFRRNPATPEQIGQRLGVAYLVEGSVRRSDDRVRVIAQLVETRHGHVLWSARRDAALVDVFALRDDLTIRIAGALAIHVERVEQRRAFAKPTENLAAYDAVLRARPALQRPDRASLAAARLLLRHAIDLDPTYADAYAALGESYYIATSMGWAEAPVAFLSRAEALSNTALRLSDTEVRAHVTLGRIDLFYHRFEQAEAEMVRAIAINPNDADALAGRGNVQMWSGRTDAAIASLELARRLDPALNAMDRFALSLAYYLKGRYDAAIAEATADLREDPGANFSRVVLAVSYARKGDRDAAATVVAAIRRTDPTFDPPMFGTKLQSAADLKHLRDGLREAGLYGGDAGIASDGDR
jgi:adenylate cyclase